jgi:DNA-binding beta-propeller fold protein YncE
MYKFYRNRNVERSIVQPFIAAISGLGLMMLAAPSAALGEFDGLQTYNEALQPSTQYVYVMDAGNARIQKFDLNGTYVSQFGADAGINLGWGLAIDAGGNTWVAAQGANALMEFDTSGSFVRSLGSPGAANSQFDNPNAISVTNNGDMWVSDQGNYRVQRFNSSGTWQQSLGGPAPGPNQCTQAPGSACAPGSADGQIGNAWSVATDAGGNVYVVDYDNGRVEKFDKSGAYQATIGSGQLANPYDAAVDGGGNIWVVDQDRVAKFDTTGNLVGQFGSTGSGNGQLSAPFGIAVDASGNIWVADNNNNRVQKFDARGNFLLGIGAGYKDVPGNITDAGSGNGQFNSPPRIAIGAR